MYDLLSGLPIAEPSSFVASPGTGLDPARRGADAVHADLITVRATGRLEDGLAPGVMARLVDAAVVEVA